MHLARALALKVAVANGLAVAARPRSSHIVVLTCRSFLLNHYQSKERSCFESDESK